MHASHRFGAGYAYWCVLLGVFVTALYTFRMIFMTFHGQERLDHHAQEHFHDVGWDMKGPLVALAIPSLLIGFLTVRAGAVRRLLRRCDPACSQTHDVVAELGARVARAGRVCAARVLLGAGLAGGARRADGLGVRAASSREPGDAVRVRLAGHQPAAGQQVLLRLVQ